MIRWVLFAFAVVAAAGPAGAVEEILRFQSDIAIGRDGRSQSPRRFASRRRESR